MTQPRLTSIQVGMPRDLVHLNEPWRTAVFKTPVAGPIPLGPMGLEGDGQANQPVHGGPDRALLGYALEHYEAWRREYPEFGFPYGSFGENLTLSGMSEETVCLGDIYRQGDALLQVSLPRNPCAQLSRRCGIPDLFTRILATGRIGWLYRVLETGRIVAPAPHVLQDRPYPQWPISTVFQTYHEAKKDSSKREAALELAACPALAESWRNAIHRLS